MGKTESFILEDVESLDYELMQMKERVTRGLCPFCLKKVDLASFESPLSLEEYEQSGLCQECQDLVFTD
jgi:hypothetical protein